MTDALDLPASLDRRAPDPFALPVFAPADVFPMMADDELQELAGDIKENGLREPLVIAEIADKETGEITTQLVDGRNRRAACKLAGVTPAMRMLNGEDPTAFVLSANIHRRNLTAGQRAMAIAMVRPPQKGGRSKTVPEMEGFSKQRIADARAVLAYSREIAEAVMRGDKPLQAALAEARQSQGTVRNERARLAQLRDDRPDLAELVTNEALSLDAAIAKAKADADAHKQQRWAATMNIIDSIRSLDHPAETAPDEIALYDPAIAESRGETVTPARLRRVADYVTGLADALEKSQ
jgi:ParB/RepB/Spo0J family partition protein